MRCEQCGEHEAEVHLTQIVDDEMNTVHLCSLCAEMKGVGSGLSPEQSPLTDFLAQISEVDVEPSTLSGAQESCPYCGTSALDFRQTGRLGCSQCYPHFAPQLRSLLRRIHGAVQHVGKVYLSQDAGDYEPDVRRATLRRRLERAIEIEDFETAASLRDQIQEMEVTE